MCHYLDMILFICTYICTYSYINMTCLITNSLQHFVVNQNNSNWFFRQASPLGITVLATPRIKMRWYKTQIC